MAWPNDIAVAQVRIVRPTDRLEEVAAFYRDGLGLPVLNSFAGHSGYDGVFFGLPGRDYHLAFIRRPDNSPCPAPTRDNLLVLYIPDPAQLALHRRRHPDGAIRGYDPPGSIAIEIAHAVRVGGHITGADRVQEVIGARVVPAVPRIERRRRVGRDARARRALYDHLLARRRRGACPPPRCAQARGCGDRRRRSPSSP